MPEAAANPVSFQPSRRPNPSGSGRGLGSRQRFNLAYHVVEDRHQALSRGLVARAPTRAVHGLQEPAQGAVYVRHPPVESAVDRIALTIVIVVHLDTMGVDNTVP